MLVQNHGACRIDEGEFSIDTLSISIDLSILGHWIDCQHEFERLVLALASDEMEESDEFILFRRFNTLISKLFPKDSLKIQPRLLNGRNFFKHRLDFADKAGFIAFGGNNSHIDSQGNEVTSKERIQIYITGEGCRFVNNFTYLHDQLLTISEFNPKITRIDIAYDDHSGMRDIELCKSLYQNNLFSGNGRPPKARLIDDLGSGDGKTFYVGSAQSGKELCCYEKGKQLGDSNSRWQRWEGRLFSKDREVPLDALIHFEEYLSGMYEKALKFMLRAARVVKTQRKKEFIQYEHLKEHARISYGPLLHYMRKKGLSDHEIIQQLINSQKFPSRLEWTSFDPENNLEFKKDIIPYEDSHPHLFNALT